jgi:hypothetical protein
MLAWLVATAAAESWCAGPLVAHEWGVTVLLTEGGVADAPSPPSWVHEVHGDDGTVTPVRTLPPDTGERDLPVVHFYASEPWNHDVPVGVEVGFTQGEASAWFPAVSARTPAAVANSAEAQEGRRSMLAVREANAARGDRTDPGPDPTRQLRWDRLVLTQAPLVDSHEAEVDWVTAARAVPGALWVNGPGESDRFLFYEGRTREVSALVVEGGDSGQVDHFVLRNRSDFDVFDVVFVHDGRAWTAPRIPAGKTAGFLLRAPFEPDRVKDWLDARWTDADGVPALDWSECAMMRDPAVPTEVASGHRLFPAELAVLWGAWEDRVLTPTGTRLLYREAPEALDAVMPLSIYPDMFHVPEVHRLGLVVVPDPPLP